MTSCELQPKTSRPMLRALTMTTAALLVAAAAAPAPAAQESRRIVAVADIHGALDSFTAILREMGLVDEGLHWIGDNTILVQTGDFTDRGPQVRAVLDLLMRLQEEAPRRGGQVIVILGNHEAMNLAGFLRDGTPADTSAFVDENSEKRQAEAYEQWTEMRKARAKAMDLRTPRFTRAEKKAWEEKHPIGYVERMDALGPDGVYGRWLRQLPTAVRIDNLLFMHAGLNPEYGNLDTDAINERVSGELEKYDAIKQALVEMEMITPYADLADFIQAADELLLQMLRRLEETGERPDQAGQKLARQLEWVVNYTDWQLLAGEGLLWFRGLALWPEDEHAEEVAALLEQQGVDHIIVGHTTQLTGEIRVRFNGGVILSDTGMLAEVYRGRPSALEIKDGTFTAYYLGERKTLFADEAAQRAWIGLDGNPLPFDSDDGVLEFLRTAEIVAVEDVGTGKTQPRRVELERHGVRARAIFHSVDVRRQAVRIDGRFYAVFVDSWRSQIAGYWMARHLGLDNVAPTVERTIGGEVGSLQLWLENDGLRTNADRLRAGEYPQDVDSWLQQESNMRVFDALIFNDDRHAENVLVDGEWTLWMIDHTRAFQHNRAIRDPELLHRIDRRLLDRLRQLSPENVALAVGDYLERAQINAILTRRDAILEHFERLIRVEGEAAILYGGATPLALTSGLERATVGDRAA